MLNVKLSVGLSANSLSFTVIGLLSVFSSFGVSELVVLGFCCQLWCSHTGMTLFWEALSHSRGGGGNCPLGEQGIPLLTSVMAFPLLDIYSPGCLGNVGCWLGIGMAAGSSFSLCCKNADSLRNSLFPQENHPWFSQLPAWSAWGRGSLGCTCAGAGKYSGN